MRSLWMIILIILCANTGRMGAQSEAGSSRSIVPSDMAFDADIAIRRALLKLILWRRALIFCL